MEEPSFWEDAERSTKIVKEAKNLKDTVEFAKKLAKPNQVVLFSPASASFDLFKNFADRGEQFKKLVNQL